MRVVSGSSKQGPFFRSLTINNFVKAYTKPETLNRYNSTESHQKWVSGLSRTMSGLGVQ